MIVPKTIGELIRDFGIKKAMTIFLQEGKITDDDSVGQIVAHVNNGGVTKICKNNWEIK